MMMGQNDFVRTEIYEVGMRFDSKQLEIMN